METVMRYEILLVDDDLLVRQVVAEEIEEAGHIVMTASSGAAAVAILAANRTFDLVLVDYSMPDMTGLEVIRLIRANLPDLKVNFALFTAYDEIPGGQGAFEPWPIVGKATRSAELLKAVEAAARGEQLDLAADAKLSRVEQMLTQSETEPADENLSHPVDDPIS
jgi:CheY-like chemotaxis protein